MRMWGARPANHFPVRPFISSAALTLKARAVTVSGAVPVPTTRCRSRSVRTLVFPEPAGANDARRTGPVVHCRQLVERQIREHAVVSNCLWISCLGIPTMDDQTGVGQFWCVGRTAVDVGLGSVSQDDVGRAADNHPPMSQGAGGFDGVPPDRAPRAGVVVVRPHEELQAFDGKLEIGREAVDGPEVGSRARSRFGSNANSTINGRPAEPGRVQARNDALWLRQFGFADGHPFQLAQGAGRSLPFMTTARGRARVARRSPPQPTFVL